MSVIHTGRTGTSGGINTSSTGAEGSGGGGSFPLLTDLVAGWALTGGPQQTLSSAGVIASGPYNWTEVTGVGGSLIYSADGVERSDVGTAELRQSLAGALVINDQDFFVSAELLCDSEARAAAFNYDDVMGGSLFYCGDNLAPKAYCTLPDPDSNYVDVSDDAPIATRFLLDVWYDHLTDTLSLSVNNGTASTATLTGGVHSVSAESLLSIAPTQEQYNTPARRVRYVIGDISAWVASRTWRYNSGNGRSDAEIAAYTG